MNKEQQTIKKIQELVPEIMELKFGCKIGFLEKGMLFNAVILQKNHAGNWLIKTLNEATTTIPQSKIKKILGRDITLEDIILACKRKDRMVEADVKKKYLGKAVKYEFYYREIVGLLYFGYWIPNKPFQDQSQECKDFIGDLILKN